MVSVFLSHSSKDKPFVRELADSLRIGGEIKVWLDEGEIQPGDNIVSQIAAGLEADFVLFILSPDSVASNWVKEEWTDAYWEQVNSGQIKLAGVLYRDCNIPRLLRNKSYIDARTNHPEAFRKIRTWLLGQLPAPPPIVHLPQRSPRFIGREPEIAELRQRLTPEGSVAYISGLAGRGKTSLAIEFAHRYKSDFASVHWLPCQGRTLTQIAGELDWQLGLKLQGDLDYIVHELTGHCARKRCLLIFDNVDDENPARLMPAGRSSVLITTRYTNLRFLRSHQPLKLPLFTEEQCFELFIREIGKEEVELHSADARILFQRLEYLPIGIAVAASLVREDVRYTIAGMARNLPADTTALLKEAVTALTPPTQTLLAAMAVCAPEGFRLALAAEIAGMDEQTSLNSLQEIYSRSLAEELDRTKRRYRLHALVREAAAPTDTQRQAHAEFIARQFVNWENNWRECEEDMADWQIAFASSLEHTDENAWHLANRLAYQGYSLTRRLGRPSEAHEISARMVKAAENRKDLQRQNAWYGNQALILTEWGRLDEAIELHKREEAFCLEVNDLDGMQACYGNQASILMDLGRLDEAMELLKKVEVICLELNDQDGLQLSLGNQALILREWGLLDEAMELHKREEAICLELGNQNDMQRSYGNQAAILKAWGLLEATAKTLEKQETICHVLGNKTGLAFCYWSLGLLARDQHDHKTEKEKLEQALTFFTDLKMPRQIKGVQADLAITNSPPPADQSPTN